MPRKAFAISAIALASGCYFKPDTHDSEEDARADPGMADTGVGNLDASLDALALPPDARGDGQADAGCASDDQCPSTAPQCRSGACLACNEPQDCARFPATPACSAGGACVACASDQEQACTGATPACDPDANLCVQCVVDADCPSEKQAACGTDHTCGTCKEDADCTRFNNVCDPRSGACVECRPESEEADCRSDTGCDATTANCAGRACDPKLLTCTGKQRGSVKVCEPCISDSECAAEHRCVAMTFGSGASAQTLGSFCLKRFATGCSEPFTTSLSRASANGAPAESYCGLAEADTSCAAVQMLQTFKACDGTDASCGAPGAICGTVRGVANRCSYECGSGADCPTDFACGGSAGEQYCGG